MTRDESKVEVPLPGEEYLPDTNTNAMCSGDPHGDLIADFWIARQLRVIAGEKMWLQVLYGESREKTLAKIKPVLMGLNLKQRNEEERTYLHKDGVDMFVVYRQLIRTGWIDGMELMRREVQEEMLLLKED